MSDTVKDSKYLLQKAKDSEDFAFSKKKKRKKSKKMEPFSKKDRV